MADGKGSAGNPAMALLLGALVVIVICGGAFFYSGGHFPGAGGTTAHTVNLNVSAHK